MDSLYCNKHSDETLCSRVKKATKNVISSVFVGFFLLADDGKLSFDEFKAYFSDGVLTAEELKELFHTIDTHNTE